jgi:hypothetical protein
MLLLILSINKRLSFKILWKFNSEKNFITYYDPSLFLSVDNIKRNSQSSIYCEDK